LKIPINRDQWLNNRQKTASTQSNQPQPQKHGFPHCSTMAKTIDRTQKSLSRHTNLGNRRKTKQANSLSRKYLY